MHQVLATVGLLAMVLLTRESPAAGETPRPCPQLKNKAPRRPTAVRFRSEPFDRAWGRERQLCLHASLGTMCVQRAGRLRPAPGQSLQRRLHHETTHARDRPNGSSDTRRGGSGPSRPGVHDKIVTAIDVASSGYLRSVDRT